MQIIQDAHTYVSVIGARGKQGGLEALDCRIGHVSASLCVGKGSSRCLAAACPPPTGRRPAAKPSQPALLLPCQPADLPAAALPAAGPAGCRPCGWGERTKLGPWGGIPFAIVERNLAHLFVSGTGLCVLSLRTAITLKGDAARDLHPCRYICI